MTDVESLKDFYRSRSKLLEKNPNSLQSLLYDYDDTGNLVKKNKDGSVEKTIQLPNYRAISFEEFDEMDNKRNEAIAIATKQFEDARNELFQEYQNPDRMDSTILQLNRKMKEADSQLQFARFPLYFVDFEDGIVINTLDFTQPNEKRKYPYNIAFYKTNPYLLEEQYVRIGEVQEPKIKSVSEIKNDEEKSKDIPVILFEDSDTNEYGFLSLDWAVQLQMDSTMYNSAKQALAAELAKQFNDQTHLEEILLAESPNEISYSLDDVPGDKDSNEIKWNEITKKLLYDINMIKFSQYPELSNRLLETKSAILGAYQPDDTLIGIGLSIDRLESKNPVNWTGQNLLGKILMEIRESIRNKQMAIEPVSISVKEPKPKSKKTTVKSLPKESSLTTQKKSIPSTSVPSTTSLPVISQQVVSQPSVSMVPVVSQPAVSMVPVVSQAAVSMVPNGSMVQGQVPAQIAPRIIRKPIVRK